MTPSKTYLRPPFESALAAWKTLLDQRGLPTELFWLFEENLCFESDPISPGGFRLTFQTAFTPPPPAAERITYEYFAEFDAPLVFYRLGSSTGRSACLLLCDEWFSTKTEADGFFRRDEWLIAFRPGEANEIDEITDRARWQERLIRGRPLHDLDFCMTLRAVHESLAHGRVLSFYERSTLRLLHFWRQIFGGQAGRDQR